MVNPLSFILFSFSCYCLICKVQNRIRKKKSTCLGFQRMIGILRRHCKAEKCISESKKEVITGTQKRKRKEDQDSCAAKSSKLKEVDQIERRKRTSASSDNKGKALQRKQLQQKAAMFITSSSSTSIQQLISHRLELLLRVFHLPLQHAFLFIQSSNFLQQQNCIPLTTNTIHQIFLKVEVAKQLTVGCGKVSTRSL